MFSLEIDFNDGDGGTETVFVRRHHAVIGASDYSHVLIDELAALPYELHLYRGIGRGFRTQPVVSNSHLRVETPAYLDREYQGEACLQLGSIELTITALDLDLCVMKGDALDKVAAQILQRACEKRAPHFPALTVSGEVPMTVSFSPDLPLSIGRDRDNALRLDAPDVSARHANISYEDGRFFIEDVGSTNGTYVGAQQISGRSQLPIGKPVIIGRTVVAYAVDKEEQVVVARETAEVDLRALPEERYPLLMSLSEVVRPQKLLIQEGKPLRIGRDPSSDLWLGAPHVSRKHSTIEYISSQDILVTDLSMNGLAYDGGVLTQGETVHLESSPCVLNFGGGITVAICFSEEHEQQFVEAHGSPAAFTQKETGERASQAPVLIQHSLDVSEGNRTHESRDALESSRSRLLAVFASLGTYERIGVLLTAILVVLAFFVSMQLIMTLIF
ncbi:MAG: FHA domain-containing protein [Bdellovibrionota bacterium]|jgi:pSer/pThr/pTyr-binding forkhead associated (FHA) protein